MNNVPKLSGGEVKGRRLKVSRYILVLLVLSLCLPAISFGKTFYVRSQEELYKALADSSNNREDDTILVTSGVSLSGVSWVSETGFTMRVEGGYDDNFTFRSENVTPPAGSQRNGEGNALTQGAPEPQQSTTGPVPPEGVTSLKEDFALFPGPSGGTMQTLGVPGYAWRHGCGGTAVGMVVGFYDIRGYWDLFDGDASTQTSAVNQGIASQRSDSDPGHYEDYSLPIDDTGTGLKPDRSELPAGDEHTSDSIADFMQTSWSSEGNYYGWSWSSDITPSFVDYVNLKNSTYSPQSTGYYMYNATLTWSVLVNEINNNRPMVFLVDTDGNGGTDHFVAVVGYRDTPTNQYGCLDTWAPYDEIRWCNFEAIASGKQWGIWGGWSFSLAPLACSATTNSATFVGHDSAQLNGTVNPGGRSTTYWFEYGQTASYGMTTPSGSAGSGTDPVAVSMQVSGLLTGTVYHFRLVAYNGLSTVYGSDKTFRTIGGWGLSGILPLLLD